MASRPRLFLWDSAICFRCSVRAFIRHKSGASARRQRSSKPSAASHDSSFKAPDSLARSKSSRRRRDSDIRHQLRVWAALPQSQPALPEMSGGDGTSNLARPEDVVSTRPEPTSADLDDAPSPLQDLSTHDNQEHQNISSIHIPDLDALDALAQANPIDKAKISPGDLLEISPFRLDPFLVVFLGFSRDMKALFLDAYGKACCLATFVPVFHHPALVPPSKLQHLISYFPDSPVNEPTLQDIIPRKLAYPIIHKIRTFKDKVHHHQSTLESSLAAAHGFIAHPTRPRYLTTQSVVKTIITHANLPLDPNASEVEYAVSSALCRNGFGFVPMQGGAFSIDKAILVHSKQLVDSIHKVEAAVRAYHEQAALNAGGFRVPHRIIKLANKVQQFVNTYRLMAREMPAGIRKTPDAGLFLTPSHNPSLQVLSPTNIPIEEFSDNDLDFIRLLRLSCLDRDFKQHPLSRSITANLLRILDAIEIPHSAPDLNLSARNVLLTIGAMSPYSPHELQDVGIWPLSDEEMQDLEFVNTRVEQGVSPESATDFHDSMKHLRKDWGDLPVFAIDSPGTKMCDDGISIEPVRESPGHIWIHCHFAHVSAFASPNSLVGKVAAHHGQTKYFVTSRFPMLPKWVEQYCSLSSHKSVLTFSAKLDAQGNMLATRVQPGIVRNVIKLSKDQANEVFSPPVPESRLSTNIFQVGKADSSKTSASNANESDPLAWDTNSSEDQAPPKAEHTADLKAMFQAAKSLSNQLFLGYVKRSNNLRMFVDMTPWHSTIERRESVPKAPTYHTEPAYITLKNEPEYSPGKKLTSVKLDEDKEEHPSERIVERFMMLSGIIAGEWGASRNIPLLYRATRPFCGGIDRALEYVKAEWSNGRPNFALIQALQSNFYSEYQTSSPAPNYWLRAPQMAPVSNPLRSYPCLVNHWQIDAVLKHEAETRTRLSENAKLSFLPFQKADIDEIGTLTSALSHRLSPIRPQEIRFWAHQLFSRGHYFNEISLPSPLLCSIGHNKHGHLIQAGINCHIEQDENEENLTEQAEGEVWEVKIKDINPVGFFAVTPLRCVRTADGTWLGDYEGYQNQVLKIKPEHASKRDEQSTSS